MIAGLKEREDVSTRDGIPFLSRVPGVGRLFSRSEDKNEHRELIIFLTPFVVDGEHLMPWDIFEAQKLPESNDLNTYGNFSSDAFDIGLLKDRPGKANNYGLEREKL
jgi:Flp pilus assembly secretin CpaC